VLPPLPLAGLRHLTDRVRLRDQVLGDWRLRRGGGRGEAVTALFAGQPGTGKTMAAEVIAGELGLDLYVIDLSSVVDKYIGETEKNLERVFAGAEGVNGVLFFDEADALFGKRSEVSDARDRYANLEIAYLLQRMETFDGLAVLATNLRANLDDAFARRLSLVVEFGKPDVAERRLLWTKCLSGVPLASDVDLDFCAESFELAGGDIRNIAVTVAYVAAAEGGIADMSRLMRAMQVEYRKLGRMVVEAEFGRYYPLLVGVG
jgi:SpoVK/Ycf46/Vps4 family AAA+-type ATPase